MNRTRISWVRNPDGTPGFTFNPVTGCLHGCDYCYARKMSARFQGFPIKTKFIENAAVEQVIDGKTEDLILDNNPGFTPTFWGARLGEPISLKKPSTIFVCSMADLFGDWVLDRWIEQILNVVHACPQHTFLFLTKNGARMCRDGDVVDTTNAWYGQTCTGVADRPLWDIPNHRHFLSFEPLLGDYIPDLRFIHTRWLIIGSLNQNGKPVHPSKGGTRKEWVLPLLDEANKHKIPVFIKPELYQLYPDLPQRQELPYLKGEGQSKMNQEKKDRVVNEISKITNEEFKERLRNDDEFHESVMELLEESPEAMRQATKMMGKLFPELTPKPENN